MTSRLHMLTALAEYKAKARPSQGKDFLWLMGMVAALCDKECERPVIYHAEEEAILFEWDHLPNYPTLEINLESHQAHWHTISDREGRSTDGESLDLDMNDMDSWEWFQKRLGEPK